MGRQNILKDEYPVKVRIWTMPSRGVRTAGQNIAKCKILGTGAHEDQAKWSSGGSQFKRPDYYKIRGSSTVAHAAHG